MKQLEQYRMQWIESQCQTVRVLAELDSLHVKVSTVQNQVIDFSENLAIIQRGMFYIYFLICLIVAEYQL
jgi:hypothetical protein